MQRLLSWVSYAGMISVLLLGGSVTANAAPSNAVILTELTGSNQGVRPFTISRVFAQGEISNFAQPVINGAAPAAWQNDVKTRWPDGSLRHVLISFMAAMGGGSSVSVSFVNNPNRCSSGGSAACDAAALDQQGMLNFNTGGGTGSWGARLDATASGITKSIDIKTMLGAGKWSYWLRGPVATQVIVEDRSTALSYDFGWTCNSGCSGNYSNSSWSAASSASGQSLHPIFVATFYQGYGGVKIEYILENVWSNREQDQHYDLTLRAGQGLNTVFSAPGLTHWAETRWRKIFWSGAPGAVKIDYNLPYLIYSKAIPSFDLTKQVGSGGINGTLSDWSSSDKGALLSNSGGQTNGLWFKDMRATGGRQELGLFPTWVVRYLYTFHTTASGDSLYSIMLGNAEVSGYVPIHVREANTSAQFCGLSTLCSSGGLQSTPAFGRVQSRDAFPTGPSTSSVGPTSSAHGWVPDFCHEGDFAYIPYLITGDWYFLEELYFWSASNINGGIPGSSLNWQSHDDWCYVFGDTRCVAWTWRTLGETAAMAPDGSPEKAYFMQKMLNNIAVREGQQDVRDGYAYTGDNTKWQWGYTVASATQGSTTQTTHVPNPLHVTMFEEYASKDGLSSSTKYPISPWMNHYFLITLGHLDELGIPVTKYKQALYKNAINQLQNPTLNPYLIASYRAPAVMQTGTWPQTWSEFRSGFTSTELARTTWDPGMGPDNPDHGYPFIAKGAASFFPGTSDGSYTGDGAWQWFQGKLNESLQNDNPKWAFVPRTASASTPPSATCDLNGDGNVNSADVQLSINAALGLATGVNGDLNSDGKMDVVDTQRVVNAALGSGCRIGP
jgi:hypothetical protein